MNKLVSGAYTFRLRIRGKIVFVFDFYFVKPFPKKIAVHWSFLYTAEYLNFNLQFCFINIS